MISLILGGARSGKSSHAEQLAKDSGKEVIYIATGEARDEEMRQRIIHHQNSRPSAWQTIEESVALASVLKRHDAGQCLLVDCLTLWLCNILFDAHGEFQEDVFMPQKNELLDCLPGLDADVIFVSNEVGCGVVPMDRMSRRFVDEAGRLHQQLAERCDSVVLVTAGLQQVLK